MPTAQLLHLLTAPPQAIAPDSQTVMSATAPGGGIMTVGLLDPAAPTAGLAQVVREYKLAINIPAGTYNFVLSRFLSKPLPAQTIGAGTWKLAVVLRNAANASLSSITLGFCLAQWRPGTGVIARAVDSPGGGVALNAPTGDLPAVANLAGSALTLLANDCLALEVWAKWINSGTLIPDFSLLLGGTALYYGQGSSTSEFATGQLTDTDATLFAPAPITFS